MYIGIAENSAVSNTEKCITISVLTFKQIYDATSLVKWLNASLKR